MKKKSQSSRISQCF